jgi:hypothetical protein
MGQVFSSYCPGGCHGHQFWHKNQVVVLQNCFPKLVFKKAQNSFTIQLIEAISYVERMDATIGTEDLSYCLSYQMLTTDKKSKMASIAVGWNTITYKLTHNIIKKSVACC